MTTDQNRYSMTGSGRIATVSLALGIGGLILSALGYVVDHEQLLYSYLTAFVFWVSIALGGLFFVLLHHLVAASWSVVLRRISENLAATLPLLALFSLPILLGIHGLYHWSHADIVAGDAILQKKAGYLNIPFFWIRTAFYFAVWSFLAVRLNRLSLKQDAGHSAELTQKFRRTSAPGMILFALTITFASFDWVMSLDPHWYSTIFGPYIFSGAFLALLSTMIIIIAYMRGRSELGRAITPEHYHDLGKLIFAFIIFWSYMAYSQYFLIWYANIPEETVWFLYRWEGSWKAVSMVILFGHFVLPFVLLITRVAKRNLVWLSVMAVWILLMRWVDLYWLIFPSLHKDGAHLSWMDLTTMIGIGGVFAWYFFRLTARRPLVPVSDPELKNSMEFVSG